MTAADAFIQATKVRARAYYLIYDEMLKEFGRTKAREVFSKAIYRLGLEKAGTFPQDAGSSAKAFADAFVIDPLGREVFAQSISAADDANAVIEMKNCPLVDAWKEMKLPGETIRELCDIACRVDYGTVDGKGMRLDFIKRISCGDGSCILDIRK